MRVRRGAFAEKKPSSKAESATNLADACSGWYVLAQKELEIFKDGYFEDNALAEGWVRKPTDYADEKNLRRIFCFEKEGEHGSKYEVIKDERNHVYTFIIHGNDKDRAHGLVGTDNRAVVKMLAENSYDFVKSDDFIDRLKMIFQAAYALVENDAELDESKRAELKDELSSREQKYLSELRQQCDFHTPEHAIKMSGSLLKESIDDAQKRKIVTAHKKFEVAYDNAFAVIKAALGQCAALIASNRQNNPDPHDILEEIKHKEIELIANCGRPFDIKISAVEKIKMVSAQMPLGEKTLPSTHRMGDDEKTKLSNNVSDFSGVVNSATNKIEKRLVIDGHSSYCPIMQKDGRMRVYYSYLAAKEKVLQLAREQLAANPDLAETGIDINLTTLSLLTPFNERLDRMARGKNSEFKQLKDTRTGLNMLVHEEDLVLNVGKNNIKIRLHCTQMNLPVNVDGTVLRNAEPSLQMGMNGRGFFEFRQKMREQVQLLLEMQDVMNEKGVRLVDEINNYYNSSPRGVVIYREAINTIEKSKASLPELYREWSNALTNYANSNAENKAAANKAVVAVKKKVNKVNSKIDKAYVDLNEAYENDYFMGQIRNSNEGLISKIHKYLRNSLDIDEPVRERLSCMLHGLQAEHCYYERYNRPDDQAYDFHINYLLANYAAGQIIEAFCKSAEDRTGALRVKLLAYLMFKEINHCVPNLNDPDDKKLLNEYMKIAVQLAASLENTKHNSAARGYQVKEEFTVQGYNMKAGKMMAALAKGIYEAHEKKLLSKKEISLDAPGASSSPSKSKGGFLGIFGNRSRSSSKSTSPKTSPGRIRK